jgi:hypothetical protein
MKRKVVLFAALALLFVLAPQAFAQYDKNLTVTVMRDDYKLMGEVSAAAKAQDFYGAAVKLMAIADGHKRLLAISPPKGSKAEWDRLHNEVIKAAFRGVGACGTGDAAALQKEMAALGALSQEGHAKFK